MADNTPIKSHRDLTVWRKAMDVAKRIYSLTDEFPKKEEYRMTSQLIRAAISIPANIAEGNARGSKKDYAHFISIARGSAAELETLLTLAAETNLGSPTRIQEIIKMVEEVGRMLTGLRRSLTQTQLVQSKSPIPNP